MKNLFYSTFLLFIIFPSSEFIINYIFENSIIYSSIDENIGNHSNTGMNLMVSATSPINNKASKDNNAYYLNTAGGILYNGPCANITTTETTPVICTGSNDTLTASGATTYTWSPSIALNTTTGTVVIANPTVTIIYTVTGTIGNCITTTMDTVTVNPLPVVSGGVRGSYCPGGTILVFSTTGSTWTKLGDSIPTYYFFEVFGDSNKVTLGTSVNPTTTTTYVVKGSIAYLDTISNNIIDTNVCSNSSIAIDTVYPAIINATTPAPICSGGSDTISVSGGVSYTWNPAAGLNSTTDSTVIANPTTTTTYVVTDTNSYGCMNSDTLTVNVVVNQLPILSVISNKIGICPGNFDTLIASGATIYTWSSTSTLSSSSGDTIIANPTATITYNVTGTYGIGCLTDSIKDTVFVYQLIKPTIMQDGDTLISSSEYGNQWYRNDTLLASDTNQMIIVNISGEYQVNATDINGCSSLSDSMKITLAGIEQLAGKSIRFSIYPNPSSGQFTIKLSGDQEIYSVEIYNIFGKEAYQSVFETSQNIIDISTQSAGMYFVYLKSKEGVEVEKILIAK